jgi:ABC-type thiamine transport system ATPase subunit
MLSHAAAGNLLMPSILSLETYRCGTRVMLSVPLQVAFGSVWKETLTELSGGQRSLLALSLILALLLFKPAPMYILDEVREAFTSLEVFQWVAVGDIHGSA